MDCLPNNRVHSVEVQLGSARWKVKRFINRNAKAEGGWL